jgi:hypothetical protein
MDLDPSFDPYSSSRTAEDRPTGPFGINEALPLGISKWKAHVANKKAELLLFTWQRVPAERLLEQFEGFVYDWTTKVLKVRNNLDKMDAKDMVVSIFALDREARLLPYGLDLRHITVDRDDDTPEAVQIQLEQIADLQRFAISELVEEEDSGIFEKDRVVLNLYCTMRFSKLDLLKTFFQVYNDARCHFLFEIVGLVKGVTSAQSGFV